jgi:hypothetical protein
MLTGRLGAAARKYAAWNPADKYTSITLSNGNLKATGGTSVAAQSVRATLGFASGKRYFELTASPLTTAQVYGGVVLSTHSLSNNPGTDNRGWAYTTHLGSSTGGKVYNGTVTAGTLLAAGAVLRVAVDSGAGKIWFGINSSWTAGGDPAAGASEAFSGLSGTIYPAVGFNGGGDAFTANFGATAFAYSVPAGFQPGWFSY